MGMRNAAPIPIRQMRINEATTVYGRFSAISTTDMQFSLWPRGQNRPADGARQESKVIIRGDFSHFLKVT
jgi:hypothetical protein